MGANGEGAAPVHTRTRNRRIPIALAATALSALAAIVAAVPAAAQEPRECFWAVGEDRAITSNFNWTDTGGRYYAAAFEMPPGTEIVLRGRFPHSRYISFTSYNQRGNPVTAVSDHAIVPEPGSTNPFRAGARRDASERDYEVRIVAGPPPENEREANTLYLAGPDGIGIVLYRIYVPDLGSGPTGGVGPPRASLRLADGTKLEAPATCEALNTEAPADANQLYEQFDAASWPPTPPAEDPIVWERFFNATYLVAGQTKTTPAEGVRDFASAEDSGGSLSAIDIAYASARPHRGFGEVLVVEGRAPSFPATRDGQRLMGSGQVRYWSLCENELRRRSIDCLADEDAIVDAEGRFTAVMSTPGSRPANATAECGVNWLLWGPNPDSLLILRHLLPAEDFANSLAKVSEPGTEEEVVGEYLPVGKHMSREQFEARGCRAAGAEAPTQPGQPGGAAQPSEQRGPCRNEIRGSGGPDRLRGTRFGDEIRGFGGADLIVGLRAADCLRGGAGRDEIRGGRGPDELRGGPGADRLHAGPGRDVVRGGPGRDRIRGGKGRDLLVGGKGNDRIMARGGGRDTVRCGLGHDDVAIVDGRDRVHRSCEVIRRR